MQTTLVATGVATVVNAEGQLWDAPGAGHIVIPGDWLIAGGSSYLSGGVNYSAGSVILRSYGTSARTNAPYSVTVYYTKVYLAFYR